MFTTQALEQLQRDYANRVGPKHEHHRIDVDATALGTILTYLTSSSERPAALLQSVRRERADLEQQRDELDETLTDVRRILANDTMTPRTALSHIRAVIYPPAS